MALTNERHLLFFLKVRGVILPGELLLTGRHLRMCRNLHRDQG